MAGFVGQLRAKLGLDTAEFSTRLRGARQEAQGFAAQAMGSLRTLGGGALGLTALGATVAGAAVTVRNIMRDIAEIGSQAQLAGLPVEDFQELAYVAAQVRIPIDVLADGIKELNLRADEWIATGAGPAEESFRRLGFTSDDLARRLERPSELFVEIARRMERLPTAARLRVADEIFGGSGERFVALINQGADRLSDMVQRGRDMGVVLDQEVIARATILEAKFTELTARATAFFQTAAVSLFAGGVETVSDSLERMFGSLDRARAVLGEGLFDALIAQTGELEAGIEASAEALGRVYDEVDAGVLRMSADLADATGQLSDLGRTADMLSLDAIIAGAEQLVFQLRAGEIGADQFGTEMQSSLDRTLELLQALDGIDGVDMSDAIARVTALRGILASARTEAQGLRDDMGDPAFGMTLPGEAFDHPVLPQDGLGGRRSGPPPRAPREGSAAYGRGNAAGGGSSSEGYASTVADIRARTDALVAEAAALAEVAASGMEYGDATEYARVRAEALAALQAEGRALTPELRAEVDALARAYVAAGNTVETLRDQMQRAHEAGMRGAEALSDIFGAALQGGDAARNAVVRLIAEIARMQMLRGFQALAGSGGALGRFVSWIGGSLVGKNARGTESWRGGLTVVGEEGPELVNLPTGAKITPALETAKSLRTASGAASPTTINVNVTGANGDQHVIALVQQGVRAGLEQADRGLPDRLAQIQRSPRFR